MICFGIIRNKVKKNIEYGTAKIIIFLFIFFFKKVIGKKTLYVLCEKFKNIKGNKIFSVLSFDGKTEANLVKPQCCQIDYDNCYKNRNRVRKIISLF